MHIPDQIKFFFGTYTKDPCEVPEGYVLGHTMNVKDAIGKIWKRQKAGPINQEVSDEKRQYIFTFVPIVDVARDIVTASKSFYSKEDKAEVRTFLEAHEDELEKLLSKPLSDEKSQTEVSVSNEEALASFRDAEMAATESPKPGKKKVRRKRHQVPPKLYKPLVSDKPSALPIADVVLFEEYTGEIRREKEIVLNNPITLASPSGKKQITLEAGRHFLAGIRSPFKYDDESQVWFAVKSHLPQVYGKSAMSWAIILEEIPQ